MPASTVTVRAWGSRETISSKGFRERKASLLSAMLLKQWGEPRTLNLPSRLTKYWTCSNEMAAERRSVLYSRLPAQLVSLSGAAQAERWEIAEVAMVAEESFRKVRLFMAKREIPFYFGSGAIVHPS